MIHFTERQESNGTGSSHVDNCFNICFRVESGKAGCFSPKVGKKEAPRKSLRLRFSLGKSSKEAVSVVAFPTSHSSGSQIKWR